MYPNWLVLPHLALGCLWFCLAGGQMFEQQLTNLIYSNRVGSATDGSPQGVTIQRLPSQMIEPGRLHQHLQEITGSEALAPLLLELLGQSGPNWQGQQPGMAATNQPRQKEQQPQQQRPQQLEQQPQQEQQQQQHFFVYENSQSAGQTSQQPQILPGFNGVNVHPASQQQGQQPFRAPKPIQAQQQQQQYPETEPKIVKAPLVAAVQAPTSAYIATSFHSLPPGPPSLDFSLPNSRPAGTRPVSSPFPATAAPASCSHPSAQVPAPESAPSGMSMPCPSYVTTPLLSAAVLKATAG
ncbi:protein FAM170B [Drosophila subobscura]|uniref:protein FAM170B n=1 Tax=Drosophila subobscura TaxID=7241 RepID=UPI00155AE20D|nr:protein FAM170B [Drosophila subobscura]